MDTETSIDAQVRAEQAAVTDAPPKRRGRPPKDAPPRGATRPAAGGKSRPASRPKLAPKLEELGGLIGTATYATGMARQNPRLIYDAEIILGTVERLAAALEKLAAENPAVRRVLESLLAATAFGELAGAVLAIAVPIAANHGLLPPVAATMVGAAMPEPPAAPEMSPDVDFLAEQAAGYTNGAGPVG